MWAPALGVTAVQLAANACAYAPDPTRGTADDLKLFIDEAHGLGLMVLLDVVPERLPWGVAPDFSGERSRPLRDFVIGSTLTWLEKFHVDGLRFRAAHHLRDDSPKHILIELAEVVRVRTAHREVHLIFEHEGAQPALLERSGYGDIQLYNAQWSDELCHAERASALLPPDALVSFLRAEHTASEPQMCAAVAIHLLMPHIPVLSRVAERHRWLLEQRHREIIPRIPSIERGGMVQQVAPPVIQITWRVGSVEELILIANLSTDFADVPLSRGRVLWLEGTRGDHGGLHPWSVLWIVRPALA